MRAAANLAAGHRRETRLARGFLLLGSLAAALAVVLGAFGAHALKARLGADLLAVWCTAVEYHFYHALAMLAVGLLLLHYPAAAALRWAGFLFAAGLLLFSGSLYALALSGMRWLGAITPLGGLAFIGGWLLLAWGVWRAG